MERDYDYEEWLDEIDASDVTGDPRRCALHPLERLSSPNGMFDAPCGLCEAEMAEEENSRPDWVNPCRSCLTTGVILVEGLCLDCGPGPVDWDREDHRDEVAF